MPVLPAATGANVTEAGDFIFLIGVSNAVSVAAFEGNVLPVPPTSRLLGKSYEYIDIYLREYHKVALNSRSQKLVVGSLVGSVVLILFGLISGIG